MQSSVVVDRLGSVVDIRINRPEARNCLNHEVVESLTAAVREAGAREDVRCILLGGTGDEAFCAGADITGLVHQSSPAARREFFGSIATLIESVHRCPAPIVARVHGYALAGGCGLAAACDIVLASEDAQFGLPEVAIGLAPMIVMAPIHRAVGRRALADLVLTADRISASRAYEIGLVSRVVSKSSLDEEALALCKRLTKHSPQALRRSKEMMLSVSEGEYFPLLQRLADESALLSLGSEAQEGLSAFLEKREPAWRKSEALKKG